MRILRNPAWLLLLFLGGCLTPDPGESVSPEYRLSELLIELRDLRGGEFRDPAVSERSSRRDAEIRGQIRELANVHPRSLPVLVASAALAFEDGDSILAQKFLDQALRVDPLHVPAVLLRVRVAAESGNLTYARRLLDEKLQVLPDEADLHSARAGIHYLLAEYREAARELDVVEALLEGEEAWRTAYHRGLLAEAEGDWDAAREFYETSKEDRPSFERATRRWRWSSHQLDGRVPSP